MEKGEYYFNKISKNIKNFTFGLKFTRERFDVFNKFGIFFDNIARDENGWQQKVRVEEGNELINLFEFKNNLKDINAFISTSRLGFTFNDFANLKDNDIKQICKMKNKNVLPIIAKLFGNFQEFNFIRFGVFFEFHFTEKEIADYDELLLFKWFSGNNHNIAKFEEINNRYSYEISRENETEYNKIIFQFSKVKNREKDEFYYILTTDYQEFFTDLLIKSQDQFNEFFTEKFESNFELYLKHITRLLVMKDNEK